MTGVRFEEHVVGSALRATSPINKWLTPPPCCLAYISSMPSRIHFIGAHGQGFFLMLGRLSYLVAGGVAIWVAGCHGDLGEPLQSGRVIPLVGLQGRWVGPVVPTAPSCGSATTGLLTVGPQDFAFDPFQSTTVISGQVGPDHRLAGTLTRLGGQHQTLTISFDAGPQVDATGKETIAGSVVSGRCTWSMALTRG
jgi:hypothetical protein